MERATKRTYRLVIAATLLSTLSLAQIGQDKYYHFGAGVVTEYTGNNTVVFLSNISEKEDNIYFLIHCRILHLFNKE